MTYANRPQAEWQYDDNDMADREHTVIDPADPRRKRLAKAVEDGNARAASARPTHPTEPSGRAPAAGEYAYRWRKPGTPTGTSHT
ncbi:MAG: hypothetical protein ACLS6O_00135 [Bifidobacterium sp.]